MKLPKIAPKKLVEFVDGREEQGLDFETSDFFIDEDFLQELEENNKTLADYINELVISALESGDEPKLAYACGMLDALALVTKAGRTN